MDTLHAGILAGSRTRTRPIGYLMAFLTTMTMVAMGNKAREGDLQDFCVTETFGAACTGGDVIVIQQAKYGRMELGRCVKTDFGYLTCAADVMDVMDSLCSGRQACDVQIPNPMLEARSACNEEFKSYLQVKYTCVPVITTSGRACQGNEDLTITDRQGLLANYISEDTTCGTDTTPWTIQAEPGQTINFTLFDFTLEGDQLYLGPERCVVYAVITEIQTDHKVKVCGGRGRESHVHKSLTNSVRIQIVKQQREEDDKNYFLLKFEAVGCRDPVLPSNSWLRREGDAASVGCDNSDRTWQVHCHGNQWTGIIGNCSNGDHPGASKSVGTSRILSLPMDVAIVIIAGVAFVIGAVIFVLGLYIIRRRHFTRARSPPHPHVYRDDDRAKPGSHEHQEDDWKLSYQYPNANKPQGIYMQTSETGSANENEYAYVWDSGPNPPMGGAPVHQSQDSTNFDKRVNFRDPIPLNRACIVVDPRFSGSNTNAHDGQYEKRIPTHSGEDSVYETGGKPNPHQYFELDQMSAAKRAPKE